MQTRRTWLVVALVAAVAAIPTAALATYYFTDVSDQSPHAAGIEFVAETGITTGCTADRYCPGDPVTRQQMATFLYRSSGFAPAVGPVANALLLNDTFHYENFEVLTLRGGSAHECATAEPLGIQLGLAIVTHALVSSPGDGGLSPAAINVAVDYDGAPADDAYAVCFQTLDGSPLPPGEYETVFSFSALVAGDAARAAASGGIAPADLGAIERALEAKVSSRR